MGGGPSSLRLLAVVAMLAGCDIRIEKSKPVTVAAVVLDTSEPELFEQRCGQLARQIAEIVGEAAQPIGVIAYGLGDADGTGDEPRLVLEAHYQPKTKLYGKAENTLTPWLAEIVERCETSLQPSKTSPIYRAIVRALAALRAECAAMASRGETCRPVLVIVSDLVETSEKTLAKALRKGDAPEDLRLDLADIEIRACGISDRVAATRPTEIGRVEKAWAAVLGPDLVIAPSCGTWEAP